MSYLLAAMIGFVGSAIASAVGLGGAIFFRPMYRILLGVDGNVALGTPVALTFVTSVMATLLYHKADLAHKKLGVCVGITGGVTALFSAQLTTLFSGQTLMLINATVILLMGIAIYFQPPLKNTHRHPHHEYLLGAGCGVVIGLLSGFLGMGGGIFLVPLFVLVFGMSTKRAVATSLVGVVVISIPNTLAHYSIGNIHLGFGIFSAVGVMFGTLIGTHLALRVGKKHHKLFVLAAYLLAAISLGGFEILTMFK